MSDKLELVKAIGATALPLVGSALAGSGYDQQNTLSEWYDKLKCSKLTPPNWVFPIVWAYIYPSTGYASFLVWRAGGGFGGLAQGPLVLYAATLGFNWAFSPLFFGRRDVKAVSRIS
jgi:translocator protein